MHSWGLSLLWPLLPEKVGERLYYLIHLGYHLATVVVKSCIGAVLASQQLFLSFFKPELYQVSAALITLKPLCRSQQTVENS